MGYWENRQAQIMYEQMEDAEKVAQELADIYAKSTRELNYQIGKIFDRFADKHELTEAEARRLLGMLKTPKDIAALKAALAADPKNKALLAELESPAYRARIERLENLQTEIDKMMQEVYGQEKRVTSAHYANVFQNSYYRGIYEIQRKAGFQFSFSAVDPNMLNMMLAMEWSGKNYSSRIWSNLEALSKDLKEQLILGYLTGKPEAEMANEIANKFAVSNFKARRLVRTESSFQANMGQQAAFKEAGVGKYRIVATLDMRTSEKCREMDGKVFETSKAAAGVNMPPFHPFCRTITVAELDDEDLSSLKRRARNPETGESELIPADTNYREWYKKNVTEKGLENLDKAAGKGLPKPEQNDMIKQTEKPKEKPKAEKMSIDTFPEAFREKAEAKSTQALIDFVNGREGADPVVVALYNRMGKMESVTSQGIPFKISHAKDSSVRSSYYLNSGKYAEVKLTIPKMGAGTGPGAANTVLHENMHLIDLYLRDNIEGRGSFSNGAGGKLFEKAIEKSTPDIGEKAAALFKEYGDELDKVRSATKAAYEQKISDLTQKYYPDNNINIWGDIKKYKQYEKERKKIYTAMADEIDINQRNAMGGGINNMQDIYDALSGGEARDKGLVRYGHGSKYYTTMESKKSEILANYGALSVARPDLLEILREDKPELIEALDNMVEEMLKKVGE